MLLGQEALALCAPEAMWLGCERGARWGIEQEEEGDAQEKICAPTVPISKQDRPGLRLLGGQSDLSSYRGWLLGRPRGDQEGSRARTTQALELLLGKLGSATAVGDQRSPWWYLPEITARCASCWEPREGAGSREKVMC